MSRFDFPDDRVQEKCVDIALASEMLYLASVNAYDVAVIIAGDRDFIPALEKIRLLSKRVAIVSMKNACSKDLAAPTGGLNDFDVIWLDNHIQDFIRPKDFSLLNYMTQVDPRDREFLKFIVDVSDLIYISLI
jgi:hypothetical protein